MRAAPLLAVLAMVTACIPISIGQPGWVTDRRPLPPCGSERVSHEGGYDEAARRCLLDAWESGEDAELVTAATTVEGDLVTRYLRVHAGGEIELIVDATQDAYGSGRWERFACERLVPVEEGGGPPEAVFVEESCTPTEPVP